MITVKNVTKVYQSGDIKVDALKNIDLSINDGEIVVLLGPSGSGKSTLLNILSGLDSIDQGEIVINDQEISSLNQVERTKFRRNNLGFIFQQYNLLPSLTVFENIEIGAQLSKNPYEIKEIMNLVGIEAHINKYPYQLSGGEQQRVSIARAIVKKPNILFCDEPTGALDEETSKEVLSLIQRLNKDLKTTIVLITHNPSIAEIADKVITLNSGEIVNIKNQIKKKASLINWG